MIKLKEKLVLQKVADSYIIVPVGPLAQTFPGVIRTNETGASIFRCLSSGMTVPETARAITEEYQGVTLEKATADVQTTVHRLMEAGLVTGE
ncbi:MAG: PqqD family protein [Clostridia bacterium]|nr:PqqD family protein [Clostridia bacterium]